MLGLLVVSAIRATLVAAAAALVCRVTRVRHAAALHVLWTGVVVTMFLLPGFVAWGPSAAIRLLPPPSWQSGELSRTAPTAAPPQVLAVAPTALAGSSAPRAGMNWNAVATTVYLSGVVFLMLRLAIGFLRVRVLLRQAVPEKGYLTHPSCAAPVTVGYLRPAVILPSSCHRWPAGQLSAILAHERQHVLRRDPLIHCIALLNRAIFWFHPLAWWLERTVVRLSEEACDAAVISRGHGRREYAECLLAVARSVTDVGARLDVLGSGADGASLASRIRIVLTPSPSPADSRLRLACVALACILSAVAFTAGSVARGQLKEPSFEVASIKPNKSGEPGGSSGFEGSSYRGINVSLMRVVRLAYSPIQEFVGASDWMNTERHNILAKAEGNPTPAQMRLMLRSLLADRFKLVVHKETREKPAFALVLARPDGKLGPSLRRSEVDCSPSNRDKAPKGACGFRAGPGILSSRSATMDMLASELILTGRLVVNRTGLTGSYDLDLRWMPDEFETSADLIIGLREQLGLKLEEIRAPVEVIVIEKAERPSEN